MPAHCERSESQIEVTPEMIEAGARAGWKDPLPPEICSILAERIYRAMECERLRAASERNQSPDGARAG
jgi:hypothetical protein